jgi:hypothetical protein
MTEHFVVQDPDGPDLEFEGELLVDEHLHDVGFVKVYRTEGGSYVLTQNLSKRPGQVVLRRTRVLASAEELVELLGHSTGAKAVAAKLGVATRRRI